MCEPVDGHLGHGGEFAFEIGDPLVVERYLAVCFIGVEFQYALHAYLQKPFEIVVCQLPHQLTHERLEPFIQMRQHRLQILPLLKLAVLVDTLLYKDPFERCKIQLFLDLIELYLQLAAQKFARAVGAVAQKLAHGEEMGLVVADHTAVGRDRHLAVGEVIQRVDCLVARCAREQMHHYVGLLGGVVINLAYLYLPLLESLEYGGYDHARGLTIRYLGYGEGLVVYLLYLGPDFHHSAALAVVIAAHIYETSGGEIGIKRKFLPFQVCDGGIYKFIEIMGQDL